MSRLVAPRRWLATSIADASVIVGPPGSGKSTLVRYLDARHSTVLDGDRLLWMTSFRPGLPNRQNDWPLIYNEWAAVSLCWLVLARASSPHLPPVVTAVPGVVSALATLSANAGLVLDYALTPKAFDLSHRTRVYAARHARLFESTDRWASSPSDFAHVADAMMRLTGKDWPVLDAHDLGCYVRPLGSH